jgi:AcrR family transcriptional regulator
MLRAVAERGYDDVSVADIVERAGISRTAFYDEFASKDECLFAAYERLLDRLVERLAGSYGTEDPWPIKVRLALEALLENLASEPELARMAAVDLPSAGPAAHGRYRDAVDRFLPFLREGRRYAERPKDLPGELDLMALGGAEAIIFDEIVAGRTSTLPALLPDILFAVLVPYLGPEEAVEEMRRAASRS